jgi:hypothetical protein
MYTIDGLHGRSPACASAFTISIQHPSITPVGRGKSDHRGIDHILSIIGILFISVPDDKAINPKHGMFHFHNGYLYEDASIFYSIINLLQFIIFYRAAQRVPSCCDMSSIVFGSHWWMEEPCLGHS